MRLRSLLLTFFLVPVALFGGYSHLSDRWSPEKYFPNTSVQEHYDLAYQEMYQNHWDIALNNFMVVVYHFSDSPFYADSVLYAGICHFFKANFELANRQFDKYLSLPGKLKHFEKAFDFKLEIANYYAQGRNKHLFGLAKMPKLSSGKASALALYEEIIAALPGKEIAAKALFGQAKVLRDKKEYKESIESLQNLARRFPRHELSAESYLQISDIYLEQSRIESQNPDLLPLAQVNIQRFSKSFPADERIDRAYDNLLGMKAVYANSLYTTGRFYERKKKPQASAIYYQDTIQKYPETDAARKSQERLALMDLNEEQVIVSQK
ncbi:MAG: Cell division coordinator CpoB [Chlamydiales bacterium]|nr:Cell division coordinator CpoB [Chlamydiales bacterium]